MGADEKYRKDRMKENHDVCLGWKNKSWYYDSETSYQWLKSEVMRS